MSMKQLLRITVLFGAVFAAHPAQAVCVLSVLGVLSGCSCSVSSYAQTATYPQPSTQPVDFEVTINANCDTLLDLGALVAVNYKVKVSAGNGSFSSRRLQKVSTSHQLSYNLYTDSLRTQVIGDGTGSTQFLSGTFLALLGKPQTITVYGRIPSGQSPSSVGKFLDNLTVTLEYNHVLSL